METATRNPHTVRYLQLTKEIYEAWSEEWAKKMPQHKAPTKGWLSKNIFPECEEGSNHIYVSFYKAKTGFYPLALSWTSRWTDEKEAWTGGYFLMDEDRVISYVSEEYFKRHYTVSPKQP